MNLEGPQPTFAPEKEGEGTVEWHPSTARIIRGEELLDIVTKAGESGRDVYFARLANENISLLSILESLYVLRKQEPEGVALVYKILSKISRHAIYTEKYLPLRRAIDSLRNSNKTYTLEKLASVSGLQGRRIALLLANLGVTSSEFDIQRRRVAEKPRGVREYPKEAAADPLEKARLRYGTAIRGIATQIPPPEIVAMSPAELSRLISRYLFNNTGISYESGFIEIFLNQTENHDFVKNVLEGEV